MPFSNPVKNGLSFQDFLDIYEEDIYCAYMETGAYYDTGREAFDESEYEDYLMGHGQWSRTPSKTAEMDAPINLS